jgi:hypothetical protein
LSTPPSIPISSSPDSSVPAADIGVESNKISSSDRSINSPDDDDSSSAQFDAAAAPVVVVVAAVDAITTREARGSFDHISSMLRPACCLSNLKKRGGANNESNGNQTTKSKTKVHIYPSD